MNKQEEIREGLAKLVYDDALISSGNVLMGDWESRSDKGKTYFIQRATEILQYLHSRGVVIGTQFTETEKDYCEVEPLI